MKRLLVLGIIASSLFAQTPIVKWEYLGMSNCSPTRCLETDEDGKNARWITLNSLGADGWELVSAVWDGGHLLMVFKRPMA